MNQSIPPPKCKVIYTLPFLRDACLMNSNINPSYSSCSLTIFPPQCLMGVFSACTLRLLLLDQVRDQITYVILGA